MPADATAFADRDAASTLLIATGRDGSTRSRDEGDEHRTEAIYDPSFQRLAEVKRMYDPENIFQHNANIHP